MNLWDNMKKKPLESLAAGVLLICGIVLACFTPMSWAPALGTAMAAIGGALLSYTSSDVNARKKAVEQLNPELQSTSRHLADTVTRISRNIQLYRNGEVDPDLALDRVAQLASGLYGAVNDLHVIVGSPPDFEQLVETVTTCEEVAELLEQRQSVGGEGEAMDAGELQRLRGQLESARMQFASVGRELGAVVGAKAVEKTEERVECPHCGAVGIVQLGRSAGDSAMRECSECGQRFHIHRDIRGKAFTRPSGALPTTKYLEASCPDCEKRVPVNFPVRKPHEDRFCMECGSLLKIMPDGSAIKLKESSPLNASVSSWFGTRPFLTCPRCQTSVKAIYRRESLFRAVCRECNELLEATVAGPEPITVSEGGTDSSTHSSDISNRTGDGEDKD